MRSFALVAPAAGIAGALKAHYHLCPSAHSNASPERQDRCSRGRVCVLKQAERNKSVHTSNHSPMSPTAMRSCNLSTVCLREIVLFASS